MFVEIQCHDNARIENLDRFLLLIDLDDLENAKECTCPASRLMWALTHRLHQFHRGENEIQVSLISFASVGATPTPATNSGK